MQNPEEGPRKTRKARKGEGRKGQVSRAFPVPLFVLFVFFVDKRSAPVPDPSAFPFFVPFVFFVDKRSAPGPDRFTLDSRASACRVFSDASPPRPSAGRRVRRGRSARGREDAAVRGTRPGAHRAGRLAGVETRGRRGRRAARPDPAEDRRRHLDRQQGRGPHGRDVSQGGGDRSRGVRRAPARSDAAKRRGRGGDRPTHHRAAHLLHDEALGRRHGPARSATSARPLATTAPSHWCSAAAWPIPRSTRSSRRSSAASTSFRRTGRSPRSRWGCACKGSRIATRSR